MHETCSTYDNSLPDMNVIWSKSIWIKALDGKRVPSYELISPKNLLAVAKTFFAFPGSFIATPTCHCTDLMKFILLSTLADNYKLNLPSSYVWSCFLPDWRALKQNFTLSALYVLLRNRSTGSSPWEYNYHLLSPLLVIPLIKTNNNHIYSRYLRVGANFNPLPHMFSKMRVKSIQREG